MPTTDLQMSIDVLGRLVEMVSGLTLHAFFQDRLLDALGMVDSGFCTPAGAYGDPHHAGHDPGLGVLGSCATRACSGAPTRRPGR